MDSNFQVLKVIRISKRTKIKLVHIFSGSEKRLVYCIGGHTFTTGPCGPSACLTLAGTQADTHSPAASRKTSHKVRGPLLQITQIPMQLHININDKKKARLITFGTSRIQVLSHLSSSLTPPKKWSEGSAFFRGVSRKLKHAPLANYALL